MELVIARDDGNSLYSLLWVGNEAVITFIFKETVWLGVSDRRVPEK